MAHCSTYLVCRLLLEKKYRNLDQTGDIGATDAGTCAEFFEGPYCPKKPFRLVISSMAVVPGPYTDVAGSQRLLQRDTAGSVFHTYSTHSCRHRPYEHVLQLS